MKKLFVLLFCASLLLCSCHVGNIPFDTTANGAPAPVPGEKTVYYASAQNGDGISMKITVHGYHGENGGFYVKHNEYFLVDVELSNGSAYPIYYFLPQYGNEETDSDTSPTNFDLSCGEYKLSSSATGFIREKIVSYAQAFLAPGGTSTWRMKLAAGEIRTENYDLPADGKAYPSGIKLYGPEIYTDGACIFTGSFFFGYSRASLQSGTALHDLVITVPLSVKVVYVTA